MRKLNNLITNMLQLLLNNLAISYICLPRRCEKYQSFAESKYETGVVLLIFFSSIKTMREMK